MQKIWISWLPLCIFVVGCSGSSVPEVADPASPVVDGKAMTTSAFLDKYCLGKEQVPTCILVTREKRKQSTRGEVPKW